MKNLLLSSISVEKKSVEIGTITGKVTKKGVQTGTTKNGTNYARVSLSVGSTDYDVKHAEFVLKMKDAHLTRNGDKAEKYPLLFVDVVAYGKLADNLTKNVKAGDTIRAIGTVSLNEFKDTRSVSMVATDYEKDFGTSAEAPVAEASSDDMLGEVDW